MIFLYTFHSATQSFFHLSLSLSLHCHSSFRLVPVLVFICSSWQHIQITAILKKHNRSIMILYLTRLGLHQQDKQNSKFKIKIYEKCFVKHIPPKKPIHSVDKSPAIIRGGPFSICSAIHFFYAADLILLQRGYSSWNLIRQILLNQIFK